MYSQTDLAMDLERTLVKGFDVARVSKIVFKIYQDHGLEITSSMDRALLILMAMEEGKEFELTEPEFLALISEIKSQFLLDRGAYDANGKVIRLLGASKP